MIYVHVIASVFNRTVQMGSSFIGCIGIFAAVESNWLWNYFTNLFCFGICVTVMKHALCTLQKYLVILIFQFYCCYWPFVKTFSKVNTNWVNTKCGFGFNYLLDYTLSNKTTEFYFVNYNPKTECIKVVQRQVFSVSPLFTFPCFISLGMDRTYFGYFNFFIDKEKKCVSLFQRRNNDRVQYCSLFSH